MKRTILIVIGIVLSYVSFAQEQTQIVDQRSLEVNNNLQVNIINALEGGSFGKSGIITTHDKVNIYMDLNMEVCTREGLDGSDELGFLYFTIGSNQGVVVYLDEIPGLIGFIKKFIINEPEQTSLGKEYFFVSKNGMTITNSIEYLSKNKNGKLWGTPSRRMVLYFAREIRPIVVKLNKSCMKPFLDKLSDAVALLEREAAPKVEM